MLKIIKIHANDYFLLQEMTAKENLCAADIIHKLLNKGRDKSPFTQAVIDVWLNYWAQAHRTKYDFRPKDGAAAKAIGKALAKQLKDPTPEFLGQVLEKILINLYNTFYYGKEFTTISNNFNQILAEYRGKNKPNITGNW